MGKRSDFKRVAKDFYETHDINAVKPLIPHLNRNLSYDDPCSGNGLIERWIYLLTNGEMHICDAYDLYSKDYEYDSLTVDARSSDIYSGDLFITNPLGQRPFYILL